jgi:hypothetical protein
LDPLVEAALKQVIGSIKQLDFDTPDKNEFKRAIDCVQALKFALTRFTRPETPRDAGYSFEIAPVAPKGPQE